MSGKGSNPRPYSVKYDDFSNSWDKIFGKKTPLEVDDAKAEDEAFNSISSQGSAVVEHRAHNPEVGGAIPSPATNQ